jgi:hypothetical protein
VFTTAPLLHPLCTCDSDWAVVHLDRAVVVAGLLLDALLATACIFLGDELAHDAGQQVKSS